MTEGKIEYACRKEAGKTIFMHNQIMEMELGRKLEKDEHVEHINGNGLDNRRDNLRLVKDELSSEVETIAKSLEAYRKKHNGDCAIFVDVCGLKGDDCEVVDDRLFAFGDKKTLTTMLKEALKEIKSEEDFVEW